MCEFLLPMRDNITYKCVPLIILVEIIFVRQVLYWQQILINWRELIEKKEKEKKDINRCRVTALYSVWYRYCTIQCMVQVLHYTVYGMPFTVQCTLYGKPLLLVHCTQYSVWYAFITCTLYTVQCTVYSVWYAFISCTLYTVQCTMYGMPLLLYTVHSTVDTATVLRLRLYSRLSQFVSKIWNWKIYSLW